MKLRKRLVIIFAVISCSLLVILIPAILSYSRDIRNELSLSYGIPKEPVLEAHQPSFALLATIQPKAWFFQTYWIQSPEAYSGKQVLAMTDQIRQLQLPAFIIQDKIILHQYRSGVGPFNTPEEAQQALVILAKNKIYHGMLQKQIPNLESLFYDKLL